MNNQNNQNAVDNPMDVDSNYPHPLATAAANEQVAMDVDHDLMEVDEVDTHLDAMEVDSVMVEDDSMNVDLDAMEVDGAAVAE